MNSRRSLFIVIFLSSITLMSSFAVIIGGNSSQYSVNNSAPSTPYSTSSTLETITFLETGLLPGTNWSVTITNSTQNAVLGGGISLASYSSQIYFKTRPGTYNAEFYASGPYVIPYTISFEVGTKSYTVKVPFTDLYNVQVTAKGLPGNVTLGISLSGSFKQNYLNSYYENGYAFSEDHVSTYAVNGTYKVLVGETLSNGANLFGYAGNVTVNNSALNIVVDFHKLVLNETGLPAYLYWGFHGQLMQYFNGSYYPPDTLYPGLNRSVTVYVPTGSTFLQPVARGYYNPGFYVNITKGNTSRVVSFQKEYPVTFVSNLQALPIGTEWAVNGLPYTFDGSPANGSYQSIFTFDLPNGTYNLSAVLYGAFGYENINGVEYNIAYTYNISESTITVNGHGVNLTVTFVVTKTVVPSPPNIVLIFIIGLILISAGVFAVKLYRDRKKK